MNVWSIGLPSENNRVFNVEVDKGSTAIVGDEYEAVAASFTMPANATRASFPVTIKRSERMKSEFVFLTLELVESADFKVLFTEDHPPLGHDTISLNKVTFILSDKLPEPAGWDTRYLGTFSTLKMAEITKVTKIEWLEFDIEDGDLMPAERMNAIAYVMNVHLDEQRTAGTPVMDYQFGDDGNPLLDDNGDFVMIEMSF